MIIIMNKIENKQGAGGHCNSNRPFSLPVYTAHLIHEKWGCVTVSMSQGGVYVCMYSLLPWSGASFVLPNAQCPASPWFSGTPPSTSTFSTDFWKARVSLSRGQHSVLFPLSCLSLWRKNSLRPKEPTTSRLTKGRP